MNFLTLIHSAPKGPLFRLHGIRHGPTWPAGPAGKCGQTPSNEIWSFGNESETAIKDVMKLRESLRPCVQSTKVPFHVASE